MIALAFLVGLWVGAVGLCAVLRIEVRRRRGLSVFTGRQLVSAMRETKR